MLRGTCLGSGQGTASVAERWASVTLCCRHYTGGCGTREAGSPAPGPRCRSGQADEAGKVRRGPDVSHEALASGEEGQGGRFPLSALQTPIGPEDVNTDNRLLVEAPYSTSLEGFLESE